MNASRREFLRAAQGLAAAKAGSTLAMGLAGMAALASQKVQAADTGGGYKALVCLFMYGGSDSHNWVVPIDATGYAQYANARQDLTWPQARLQPITSTRQAAGRAFALPDEISPMRNWYESGQLAVLANVGPLVRPLTKAQYQSGVGVPAKLYSHNDQQSTWQSLFPEGAPHGWGGRVGDILMAANPYPVFTNISATGNAVFLAGANALQYQVSGSGPVSIRGLTASSIFGSSQLKPVLARVVQRGSGNFGSEYATVTKRSLETAAVLTQALAGTAVPALPSTPVTLGNANPITLANEGLARQLRLVAQLCSAGQALGMRRQVFMVSIGGFDTHSDQNRDQPNLMARVALATDWFLGAMQSIGMLNNVVLFTGSDFGRTLTSNDGGTDHGWGSHHFVAGGAVRGREIYGTFPVTAIGTQEEVGSGRLLPSTSVTELAATLGAWMGLNHGELQYVLPNIGNFAQPNLGIV